MPTLIHNPEVQDILARAVNHVPTGYAEIGELEELTLGRTSLELSNRYVVPADIVRTIAEVDEVKITGCLRYVSVGPELKSTGERYHVASIVELALNDRVFYTMPFPATGKRTGVHDQKTWAWAQARLETCSDLLLAMVRQCVPHR